MSALREAAQQALEALKFSTPNPRSIDDDYAEQGWKEHIAANAALRTALDQQQAEPLTIERLRDALVASRIIDPAAVEDPDEYDDGVTLHRIEALHRRIA